tara:strand:+ start:17880 stop:18800 length:921 start_codon:yes stop_codon:yes gene_type:complete
MRSSFPFSVVICVPTLNAGKGWSKWLDSIRPLLSNVDLLVIDSSSSDATASEARAIGADVRVIKREDFDHGATRNRALHWIDHDIVVFMTQDALIESAESITHLVEAFEDPDIGAAYGRQLPHDNATTLARHARLFNYPSSSYVVGVEDIPLRGIKTAFLSNSFAAYRRDALVAAGGFPHHTILGEDMVAGARLLKRDWKIAYQAHACVYHSHNYTPWQEFKRYFDIGVLHHREHWLLAWLGRAEGEGARFVRSEIDYVWRHAPWQLPNACIRTVLKYAGYSAGRLEAHLPMHLKRRCSMHYRYWT